jgi:glycosyltransferase involved in cell wall biosynthesis
MPKVSVVIPAYNAITYLPEAVDSVLRQTYTDFEALIIDDGSSDQTADWASQIADSRVKLISQENKGLPGARNTGIIQAQGEYIAFLDADDLWTPTKLEKQVHCLENNPTVGLVHTWMLLVDEHGKSTGRVMKSNAEGDAWKQVVEKNVIACPSVMVRRYCFETVGLFDRNLRSIEDWDMWIRIAARYPFAVIKETLAYYRQLPSSMSKNCQVMEQAFRIVIEKAFHSAPSELLYLKNRSYGYANLCLAWKALQSKDRDYKLALHFRQQVSVHYPQLRFSSEYIRLGLAIAALQWFGHERYGRALTLTHALRRRISNTAR